MASDEKLAEHYATQLDNLAQQLAEFDREPTMERSQTIGDLGPVAGDGRPGEGAGRVNSRPLLATELVHRSFATHGEFRTHHGNQANRGRARLHTRYHHDRHGHDARAHRSGVARQRRSRAYPPEPDRHHSLRQRGLQPGRENLQPRAKRRFMGTQTGPRIDATGVSAEGSQVQCSTDSTINAITAQVVPGREDRLETGSPQQEHLPNRLARSMPKSVWPAAWTNEPTSC